MGNAWALYVSDPEGTPTADKPPSFDPMLGFPNGRKERGNLLHINMLSCLISQLLGCTILTICTN